MPRSTAGPIRLWALAAELGLALEGDGEVEISGVADLEGAGPGDLVHVRSEAFAEALASCRAAAVIAPPGLGTGGRPALRSRDPRLDFARAARRLLPPPRPAPGVHPEATVDPGARVDPSAAVGPGCRLAAGTRLGAGSVLHGNVVLYADVRVGRDCVIHAGCVLREGTRLGDRVVLQPGVVLGADGFGYARDERGGYVAVPQLGRVVLEDDVEVGAGATVDRATLGETRIGRGSKIDNLVMIGHNCELAEDVLVVAQAGVAGSTRIGRGSMLLAQAGIVGHVTLGEGVTVGAQSGVTADVADGVHVLGTPAQEARLTRRVWAAMRRLPDVLTRLRVLERGRGRGAAGQ